MDRGEVVCTDKVNETRMNSKWTQTGTYVHGEADDVSPPKDLLLARVDVPQTNMRQVRKGQAGLQPAEAGQ
jgi:hypothetical protein